MQRSRKKQLTPSFGLLALMILSLTMMYTEHPHVEGVSYVASLVLTLALLLEEKYQNNLSRQEEQAPPPNQYTNEQL